MKKEMPKNIHLKGQGSDDKTFSVTSNTDVVQIREYSRVVSDNLGFSLNDQTLIVTVVSEICRNILEYATEGEVSIHSQHQKSRVGILVIAEDQGPGIPDIELALKDGHSEGRGMGVGLPGSRRIMDEFHIESTPETGTRIIMRKWKM